MDECIAEYHFEPVSIIITNINQINHKVQVLPGTNTLTRVFNIKHF